MLRLGQQVGRDVGRVAAAVVDDQDFARAGDHVDADLAEDQLLRGRHIDVARPGDLLHPRHGCGAVGEGRNGLRPADAEDPVDAGELGGHQYMRIRSRRPGVGATMMISPTPATLAGTAFMMTLEG